MIREVDIDRFEDVHKQALRLRSWIVKVAGGWLKWHERDDVYQQIWMLIVLGKSRKEIKNALTSYVPWLRWQWGPGHENHVYLFPHFVANTGKGYEPLNFLSIDGIVWKDNPSEMANRKRRLERERANVAAGLCRCGRVRTEGYRTCQRCRQVTEERTKRSRQGQKIARRKLSPAEKRQQHAEALKRRKAIPGICQRCAAVPAEEGKRRCSRCLEYAKLKAAEARRKKRQRA